MKKFQVLQEDLLLKNFTTLLSLQNRRWFRKLCQFYNILKSKLPRYLFNIIPTKLRVYNTRYCDNRYCDNIPLLKINHNYVRNSFFPSSIVEWNKLSREVRNSENIRIFKKRLLEFIRPSPNSIFDIYNPYGIKLLTRLRLGLSHLNEHKFKHGFNDTISFICIWGGDIESINHFFLHCPEYCEARPALFDNIQSIDKMLLSQNESSLTHLLLYGDPKRNSNVNAFILNTVIKLYYLQEDSMDRYLTELKMFFSFSNSFFIWLSLCFCLFIPFSSLRLYIYPRCL